MLFDTNSVAEMAASIEAAPSELLSFETDAKTIKGSKYGYLTGILYLAPYKLAGFNVCAMATSGCAAACLNTSGMGSFLSSVHAARIRKTRWFKKSKQDFMTQLHKDILKGLRKAKRENRILVIRLNGLSDLPWERVVYIRPDGSVGTIFDAFPDVQFYDYTKVINRLRKSLPKNYDLTFSAADGNEADVDEALSLGFRVAIVFRNADKPMALPRKWNLPTHYGDTPIVDGDDSDLRFLDPPACIVGLKAKAHARTDTTGFVRDINPA